MAMDTDMAPGGRLAGKVALVTGGSAGMGAAHARILAEHGAKVAVCDVNDADGEALAAAIGGVYHHLDVTDEAQWDSVLAAVAARFGPVTILVNNAGISLIAPVEDTATQDWRRLMAVNVDGAFFGTRAVAPQMRDAGGGVIINVSSAASHEGGRMMAAYITSKWAVRGLTKASASDLAPHGIRVLSLHPALVRTPMSSKLDLAAATADYPMQRAGEPEELARMLLFMVADATYSTGCEFIADGGMLL
jgi:3alpha(or 20beta)-hydroxysteroid dehydrogenase